MARLTMPHRPPRTAPVPLFIVATLFVHHAAAAEPGKDAAVTLTFAAPAHGRATLTVNADDPSGPPTAFKVRVGTTTQSFERATPAASRTIAVPADPHAFVRFTAEKTGAAPSDALALITPDSRPILVPDACAAWDLATSGGSSLGTCATKDRHCPTATRPSLDRTLVETQCGSGSRMKYCVPDYRIDVAGEARQKVRVGVDGDPGNWITLRGPTKVRHLFVPSIGKCPSVTVESGSEHVRLLLSTGQPVLVRASATGKISAEDLPATVRGQATAGN